VECLASSDRKSCVGSQGIDRFVRAREDVQRVRCCIDAIAGHAVDGRRQHNAVRRRTNSANLIEALGVQQRRAGLAAAGLCDNTARTGGALTSHLSVKPHIPLAVNGTKRPERLAGGNREGSVRGQIVDGFVEAGEEIG
jgi:hypothetical protein